MSVATEVQMKKAFRTAYEFMEKHNTILLIADEFKNLATDLLDMYAENMDDPLTCRLLSAVYDYIGAESEKVLKKHDG